VVNINEEIKRYFAHHPERLNDISARRFEELIANILKDFGFETELTKVSRDGGRDIYAYIRNALTSFLMFVECKKWQANKVGIDVVQRVYGAAKAGGANKAMIVTTSLFTRPAQAEQQRISTKLELKDYTDLKIWLSRYQ
jgi:HJR/Mrr/RecB family endonuclease